MLWHNIKRVNEFWDERSTAFTASLGSPRNYEKYSNFLTSWCQPSLKFSTDYIFFANSLLAMTERSRVDTEKGLEAACSNLVDIELYAPNGGDIHRRASQDIANQPSSETQKAPRIADPPSSKGNKFYLHISVCYSVNESAFVNSLNQKHQPNHRWISTCRDSRRLKKVDVAFCKTHHSVWMKKTGRHQWNFGSGTELKYL